MVDFHTNAVIVCPLLKKAKILNVRNSLIVCYYAVSCLKNTGETEQVK